MIDFDALPRPAVIVPLTAATSDAVLAEAEGLAGHRVDVAEWRLDHLDAFDGGVWQGAAAVMDALPRIRERAGVPLLVTFRTQAEGGVRPLEDADYAGLLGALIETGVDAVDVELNRGGELLREAARACRTRGVTCVASFHDFAATPDAERLLDLVAAMDAAGAGVAKLAVTPATRADVLALWQASLRATASRPNRPLVAIAMGPLGAITRAAGHLFGSAATFATVGAASAPGQVPADDLAPVLDALSAWSAGPRP